MATTLMVVGVVGVAFAVIVIMVMHMTPGNLTAAAVVAVCSATVALVKVVAKR